VIEILANIEEAREEVLRLVRIAIVVFTKSSITASSLSGSGHCGN
jgi:hypothetical protein